MTASRVVVVCDNNKNNNNEKCLPCESVVPEETRLVFSVSLLASGLRLNHIVTTPMYLGATKRHGELTTVFRTFADHFPRYRPGVFAQTLVPAVSSGMLRRHLGRASGYGTAVVRIVDERRKRIRWYVRAENNANVRLNMPCAVTVAPGEFRSRYDTISRVACQTITYIGIE